MRTDTLQRLEQLLLMLADQTDRGTYERGLATAALALLNEIPPAKRVDTPGQFRLH